MEENSKKSWRILKRDGELNISREGLKHFRFYDMYHALLSMTTQKFFLLVALTHLVINVFFAFMYFLCGPEALRGIRYDSLLHHFEDCFFFSVQTISTIGYGNISPRGLLSNVIVTIEAFIGLLVVALMTGLLFARFSRPTARVIFSHVAILGDYDGSPSFAFRVANQRMNQITEAKMGLVLVKNERTAKGEKYRKIYDLELERSHSPIFALSWTLIHPINSKSPLLGMTHRDLLENEAEILAFLSGTDDTFSQTINARFSYTADDIVWNHQFKDIISRNQDGKIRIHFDGIHDVIPNEPA